MASFEGHALPGLCFLILAVFFAVEVVIRNFGNRPLNRYASIMMVSLASLGIILELFWPVKNEPPFGHLTKPGTDLFYKPMNWQHTTMYFFFIIFGCGRLFAGAYSTARGIDRLGGGLAFGVEGYLFYNHVHGRSPLDTKIHLLITLVCWVTAGIWFLTFFMENKRKIFIMDMIISMLVFAQGTWFWHVAFILYGKEPWIGSPVLEESPPTADAHEHPDSGKSTSNETVHDHMHHDHSTTDDLERMHIEHVNTMFAVLFFAWHVAAAIIFISCLAFGIFKIMKRRGTLVVDVLDDMCDANDNRSRIGKSRRSLGMYSELEMDETPLLNDAEKEEHVLFTS